jgi:hypothetical protein
MGDVPPPTIRFPPGASSRSMSPSPTRRLADAGLDAGVFAFGLTAGNPKTMIPIKIQCGCGQRYAFDVEPVDGQMPTAVACPTCGADGTEVANEIIARNLAPLVEPAPAPNAPPLRAVAAAPAPRSVTVASVAASTSARRPVSQAGRIDRTQAEHEAKAKILWGDSPEDVGRFLIMQGFTQQEASELAGKLFAERAATIRANGVRKIITGFGLICVPVVALIIFLSMKVIPTQLLGLTVMVGLWGAWMVLKGTIMMVSPKSEPGDVSEQ